MLIRSVGFFVCNVLHYFCNYFLKPSSCLGFQMKGRWILKHYNRVFTLRCVCLAQNGCFCNYIFGKIVNNSKLGRLVS